MLMPTFKKAKIGWGEAVGIVLGMVVGATLSVLLGAWIIHWILGLINIGSLTYGQVVGLLVIWELIKPRASND
jgi:uncharacterized membrane protein YoaK (UPF0700 family)